MGPFHIYTKQKVPIRRRSLNPVTPSSGSASTNRSARLHWKLGPKPQCWADAGSYSRSVAAIQLGAEYFWRTPLLDQLSFSTDTAILTISSSCEHVPRFLNGWFILNSTCTAFISGSLYPGAFVKRTRSWRLFTTAIPSQLHLASTMSTQKMRSVRMLNRKLFRG